ncbi:hypothetical protein H5996_01245 [Faecalicoccus pleomorphus]|uniref:hypothetical protein n=1 Tax=Faecalicoccus pleomorphus TaxID=1323 RepID=UPI00195F7B94|nr:hypothetical protein [Faecalicoccus pleomorphus]MBM6764530.1 hypothetical protein [Faecalicoccus pleomorphus]
MEPKLDVGFKPISQSCRNFCDTVLASWHFRICGPYELIIWYKAKGSKILTRGDKDHPFEARFVKNSFDGNSYTEIFTNGYLDAKGVEWLIQDLTIKFAYGDQSAMMPAA